MYKVFGKATDFYRVRIITLEEETAPDFNWSDDVLYRAPKECPSEISTKYSLQVVELDSKNEQVLEEFLDLEQAVQAKLAAEEDLKMLTKTEFEDKHSLSIEDLSEVNAEDQDPIGGKMDYKIDVPRNFS